MKRCLTCECGFSVTASDLVDLIEAAKHHARLTHQMSLSAEQLLTLTELVEEKEENQ